MKVVAFGPDSMTNNDRNMGDILPDGKNNVNSLQAYIADEDFFVENFSANFTVDFYW